MHELLYRYGFIANTIKFLFKIFYTRLAWTYDFVATIVSLGKWNDWVLSVLPYLKGPNILELGYGPGHLLIASRKEGHRVFGIDASYQMGRLACNGLRKEGMERVIVNGYAQFMPFFSSSFNQVVATFPSEYIISADTLSEIWRVLVPNGNLIILPFAWFSSLKFYKRAATSLSKLTGFTSDWDTIYCESLRKQGFNVQIEVVQKISSTITIIFAQKPEM